MTGAPATVDDASRALPRRPPTLTVVFAHPDDEVLFFLGWVGALRPLELRLICVTGEFGRDTQRRRAELEAAALALGGEAKNLGLEDRCGPPGDLVGVPLDHGALSAALAAIDHRRGDPVLTHGPMGEYGHRHHVDVFRAAWRRFGEDLWCAAGPLEVHEALELGPAGAAEKLDLMRTVYSSQADVADWGCGHEALCHVASSRFAPLFGASAPQAASGLALAFIDCLERAYVGPGRSLPPVAELIEARWGHPLFDHWLAARLADWRRRLLP